MPFSHSLCKLRANLFIPPLFRSLVPSQSVSLVAIADLHTDLRNHHSLIQCFKQRIWVQASVAGFHRGRISSASGSIWHGGNAAAKFSPWCGNPRSSASSTLPWSPLLHPKQARKPLSGSSRTSSSPGWLLPLHGPLSSTALSR